MPDSILSSDSVVAIDHIDIRSMIHVIRGQQVILDSDLAILYQVETKRLNEQVKRNIERFPDSFCFQLTKEEYGNLRSQSAASNEGHGGRRYAPFAFTESGIAMLSAVLHSEIAVRVSIQIMNTFVEMRRFIANNALLFERISTVELKQFEFQRQTNEKLDQIFSYISDHEEDEQKVFFDGQIYDAFSLLSSVIQKAKKEIILIDGYVDVNTLNLLAKKNTGVSVFVYTYPSAKLTNSDVAVFNAQYPSLTVKKTQVFHDRFLVLDNSTVYHIGASIKDAGKKASAYPNGMTRNYLQLF